jgi:serine protease Do
MKLAVAGSVQYRPPMTAHRRLMRALTVSLAITAILGAGVHTAAAQDAPPPSFATVIQAVAPAVVTIVPAASDVTRRPDVEGPEAEDDVLGSGVLLDPRGVVLTNAHVVSAAGVEVMTDDGRRHRPKRVLIDMRSSLAVLVIGDGVATFPYARLGDSDRVRVGDWVVAIGAPLGLHTTVTAGVVSARARDSVGPDAPDYLLTTAVMRFGSTGGPLVNVRGEVVGINTIFAFESAGIAFTVPANVARSVVPQLLETGRVSRASLGLFTQALSPQLAGALQLGTVTGLVVTDVIRGGPAAVAGVRSGDLLLALDASALVVRSDLSRALQRAYPGQDVTLRVRRRDGAQETLAVRLGEEGDESPHAVLTYRVPELGCEVRGLTPEGGVVVSRVDRRGEAAGLRAGDIVREINHRPVRTLDEFARLADGLRPGDAIAVLVQRGRTALYVALTAAGTEVPW